MGWGSPLAAPSISHPLARAEGVRTSVCLLETGVSAPTLLLGHLQKRLGSDGGAGCLRPVPAPLCALRPSWSQHPLAAGSPEGSAICSQRWPGFRSTFPGVPRGKRVGWFFPSLQNNGHSE